MDHHLEDALNLDSAMGSMDFDHSRPVVSQDDISLESTHEGDIPMEFEHIEEQPMLMDTGNEEIIVADFINDQYTLQEYSIQDDQTAEPKITDDPTSILSSQSESMIDLNFEPVTATQSLASDVNAAGNIIAVKAPITTRNIKKTEIATATMPRQVAIAPKPPKLVASTQKLVANTQKLVATPRTYGKQMPIAPKPVTLVVNKTAGLKKTTVSGVIQGTVKSNSVLTQIGKQLLMMPASGAQKIKLVSGSGPLQYAQITKKVIGGNPQKPGLTQVILRRDNQSDQPAVITKLAPSTTAGNATRYVMQQKTVPISIAGNKVILSPTKGPMKIAKKQIIAIKSPTPKLMPATSQGNVGAAKKVVITPNPTQNVILKTTAPPKSAQVLKDGNVVVQAQRSQLHQINVPGKGIQYIRLITNSSPAPQKVTGKTQAPPLAISSKNFVLADSKGNLIQMNAENVASSQPPPLVITGSVGTSATQVAAKSQKKLVRIAPATSKAAQLVMQQSTRPLQSLLAPLSPREDQNSRIEMDKVTMDAQLKVESHSEDVDAPEDDEQEEEEQVEIDSKASLRALFNQSADSDMTGITMQEVEVDYDRQQDIEAEETSSSDHHESDQRLERFILIPSSFQVKQESQVRVTSEETSMNMNESNLSNLESEVMAPYLSPRENLGVSGNDISGDMGMRPRKACNCTKSQCLKLYCDCFANGEFCNRCNCINCHNNLENEEMRQKAIRACLDRNPNAFRPKIGKSKAGGPEIVRRHTKGCNCKRSGCLKNYCECYEAKIACTAMCKCVGCRNVEETIERRRDALRMRDTRPETIRRAPAVPISFKQPCSFMTSEVIEAVCQCLVAAAAEGGADSPAQADPDPVRDVIEEFARCLQDIVGASHQSGALSPIQQGQA